MSLTPITFIERAVSVGYTPPPYALPCKLAAGTKRINVLELGSMPIPTIVFPVWKDASL